MVKRTMKLKNRFNQLPYKKRLLFSIAGVSCLTLVLAFGILAALVSGMLTQSESRRLTQLMSVVNADLGSRMKNLNSTGFDLVIDSSIRDSLNKQTDIETARARTKVESILKVKLISNNHLRSLMIIDTSLHLFSPNISLLLPQNFHLEDTQVYQEAMRGGGSLIWLSENDLYDQYSIADSMYQPDTEIHAAGIIYDYSHKKLLGLMILSLNQTYFYDIAYANDMLEDSDLYLVSPDRKKVYNVAGTQNDLSAALLSQLPLEGEASQISLGDKLIDCRYNHEMKWYLVSVTRIGSLREGMMDLLLVLLAALALGILLSVFLSHRLAVYSSRGITELIRGMEQVEREKFDVEVRLDRQDELGRIAAAFNHMVWRIRTLIQTEYQEKLLMQEARFKSLQSQINPHFLMNTFDMLHWRLLACGEEELSQTVVALSHLMQYALASDQWHVTLEQERRNVEEYLSIFTVIRGCDIRLELSLEEEQGIFLPRQTLQPLVENAIRHGFAGRNHGNLLKITGQPDVNEPERYRICVKDNGLGITPERLEEIQQAIQSQARFSEQHIGLQNVAARLRYMDPQAHLQIDSVYGSGATVTLTIHRTKEEYP